MTEKELWSFFLDKQVHISRPLKRDLVWVSKQDFCVVEHNFTKDFNVLHPGKSFRSRGYLSHIHAIDQGSHVLVHHDMGNLALFPPLAIIHLFLDVIPYVALATYKRVSFYSIFTLPQ